MLLGLSVSVTECVHGNSTWSSDQVPSAWWCERNVEVYTNMTLSHTGWKHSVSKVINIGV